MNPLLDRRLLLAGFAAGTVGTFGLSLGARAQSRTGGIVNQMHAGQALKGYDAVAYFSQGAVMGQEAHSFVWNGGTWRFASAANLDAFRREPERYAPQFGGFCAWGVANAKLFEIDPVDGWEVRDGKLYVFFNATVLKLWQADRTTMSQRADANWPKLNV